MPRSVVLLFFLSCACLLSAQSASRKDLDVVAPDGIKLRATFFSAGKPGPAVMLLHMCNTDRKSWEPVALGLSQAGISALTIDNRGFGESGGPRYENGAPATQEQVQQKWPDDFDAAYQFLMSQPGVDKSRVAIGGGSCGVGNAIRLAERHPEVKSLVLLAGASDMSGINFISQHPQRPIFTAAAADDEYNPATIDIMQWLADISGNPRSRFVGFKNGRHGTEIFGPHPELVSQIVDFFVDTLITAPVNLQQQVVPKETLARAFWTLANEPGGAERAVAMCRQKRKQDADASICSEYPVNLLAYAKLQAGKKEEALELFKLNAEAYPTSANAQDSLADGYMAVGRRDLALAAEKKCISLLPADPNDAEFKKQLEKAAEDKVAQLTSERK